MALKLTFLGGAATVTGSQFLLESDRARVLVDCGMFQGGPDERVRNYVPFAFEPAELDAVLLTHAHLDHCGLIPRLAAQGYDGPIHATAATIELATLVLVDSGRLQQEFAKREMRWERRNPDKAVADDEAELEDYRRALELAAAGQALRDSPALMPPGSAETGEHVPTTVEPDREIQPVEVDLDEPLYTERDARRAMTSFSAVAYDRPVEVAPGIRARFVDAGHILGSAIIIVEVERAPGDAPLTIVFSGDLGRPGAPILRDYTAVKSADYVLVETTYGGREHEPEQEALRVLAETIRIVAQHKGVLLVPAFAIGRTQELVYQLDRLIDEGAIPTLPLFLDSPMAAKATEIYRRHPENYDADAAELQRAGATPIDYPRQTVTVDLAQSREIERTPRPYMIVASNGMLTGGRVVNHLRSVIGDANATILFVGYQGVGTLGADLQAGARTVRVDGQAVEVRCTIRSISGFSAHADEAQILAWLKNFEAPPRRVFLVHGEPDAQSAIEPRIQELGMATHVPRWHETVELE